MNGQAGAQYRRDVIHVEKIVGPQPPWAASSRSPPIGTAAMPPDAPLGAHLVMGSIHGGRRGSDSTYSWGTFSTKRFIDGTFSIETSGTGLVTRRSAVPHARGMNKWTRSRPFFIKARDEVTFT